MTALNPVETERQYSTKLALVTVVVVTHESAHCLQALDALLSHSENVIISDNGSQDGTINNAQARWPHATVLAHERNLGFGVANNRALELVKTPFAFLLNPDCEMSVADLIQLQEAAADFPDGAIFAPQLVGQSGKPEVNYRWPKVLWRAHGPAASGAVCVGFLCGAAMLLRMDSFEGIGFFDERFFLYYEDDDLCLRLFNAHKSLIVVPAIHAIHRSRGSVRGDKPLRNEFGRGYHHAQSKLTFVKKYKSLDYALGLRRWLLLTTALGLPLRALFFSPRLLARMVGRWKGLFSWRGNG